MGEEGRSSNEEELGNNEEEEEEERQQQEEEERQQEEEEEEDESVESIKKAQQEEYNALKGKRMGTPEYMDEIKKKHMRDKKSFYLAIFLGFGCVCGCGFCFLALLTCGDRNKDKQSR